MPLSNSITVCLCCFPSLRRSGWSRLFLPCSCPSSLPDSPQDGGVGGPILVRQSVVSLCSVPSLLEALHFGEVHAALVVLVACCHH